MRVWRWLLNEIVHAFINYRSATRVIVALLALVFILDFVFRVHVGRNPSLRLFTPPEVPAIAKPEGPEVMKSRILVWFPPPTEPTEAVKERVIGLQGVFGSREGRRAALTVSVADGSVVERVRATEGQVVEGWTVAGIEPGRVVLRRDDETKELLLFRPRTE